MTAPGPLHPRATAAGEPGADPARWDPDLATLREAARSVHAQIAPTLQFRWPLLEAAVCAQGQGPATAADPSPRGPAALWIKHENHAPLGAFKVRGGLLYLERLMRGAAAPRGLVSATRGNHGQSIGLAARRHGVPAAVFVPHGNSREKNAAMRALGVELIEHGQDFQAAREAATACAAERGWHLVPSFHADLVQGVASYALELFDATAAHGGLDAVYVPIGLGSGACGLIAARDALGLATEIVGVVAEGAPTYALSLAAGRPVPHPATTELADGMACSVPEPQALRLLARGLARTVTVGDAAIAAAMRLLYEATHQVAEGAGAAALAAVRAERERLHGRRVAAVLTGGNIDRDRYAAVLAGGEALG